MKGRPPETEIKAAVLKAERDVCFLIKIHHQVKLLPP